MGPSQCPGGNPRWQMIVSKIKIATFSEASCPSHYSLSRNGSRIGVEIMDHGNIDMTSRDNVSNGISGKVYGSVVSNGVSKLSLVANNASYYPNFTGTASKMETGILMSASNRDATETKQLQLKYPNYEKYINNITEGTIQTDSINPPDIYLLKLSRTSHKMPTKIAQYSDDKNSGGSDRKSVLYSLKFPETSHKMADEKARYSDRDDDSSGGSGLNSLLYPLKLSRPSHKMADERAQYGNGVEKSSGGSDVNLVRRKRSFGLITLGALGVTALARKLFHHHHHHHDHHEYDLDHDHGHHDDHHHECHTTPILVLNSYLLLVSSPLQHKCDALHHVTTEAAYQEVTWTKRHARLISLTVDEEGTRIQGYIICSGSFSNPLAVTCELSVSTKEAMGLLYTYRITINAVSYNYSVTIQDIILY
uniref:Uncharacterized protein n=1 Tax=Timema bartmani TaxID=61472 RepID=A0A7R9F3B6_9NEOP|nr:unnamed protein product [Timema bartmani]